jgi:glycosyltransferase involved in cell wall biosynthesis
MPALSVVITTFNNDDTLAACLRSVAFADECLVLDSFSTDRTLEIATAHGCRIEQHRFLGYGKQKQLAVDQASNDWILLLDADECLTPALADEIVHLLQTEPAATGYVIPRCEQVFWKMSSPRVRTNKYLRLWDRRHGRLSTMPIHAAPEVSGRVDSLTAAFLHFGELDIHIKVDKVNAYSTGLVKDKVDRGKRANPWVMIVYPPWYFFRSYVLKRGFFDGWAGFIASVVMAFYAFMKYAKLYEHERIQQLGDSLMPENAPRNRRRSSTAEPESVVDSESD